MLMQAHTTSRADVRSRVASPGLMLALATIGFAVNFWAWALISPLGPMFRQQGTWARSTSPTSR
jgi:MFS transporter, NNP family, nitrate/nitrite transporter